MEGIVFTDRTSDSRAVSAPVQNATPGTGSRPLLPRPASHLLTEDHYTQSGDQPLQFISQNFANEPGLPMYRIAPELQHNKEHISACVEYMRKPYASYPALSNEALSQIIGLSVKHLQFLQHNKKLATFSEYLRLKHAYHTYLLGQSIDTVYVQNYLNEMIRSMPDFADTRLEKTFSHKRLTGECVKILSEIISRKFWDGEYDDEQFCKLIGVEKRRDLGRMRAGEANPPQRFIDLYNKIRNDELSEADVADIQAHRPVRAMNAPAQEFSQTGPQASSSGRFAALNQTPVLPADEYALYGGLSQFSRHNN
jgi:hypothetical protein